MAAVVVTPLVGEAKGRDKVPRIAYLGGSSPAVAARWQDAFRQGLREHGYIEAQSIVIEWRSAEGRPERIPELAAAMVATQSFTFLNRERIAELALRHKLPTFGGFRELPLAGGLMSYGVDSPELWRRAARYVDRIIKGQKPSDLPIEQPSKFELIINVKTAKALGVTVPPPLMARADQVIE